MESLFFGARDLRVFDYAMYSVVVLFVVGIVFPVGHVMMWIWHILLISIIVISLKDRNFFPQECL